MPARRPMTPDDLRRVVVVEELELSRDGRTAIVVRRSIAGNRYLGHLYAIDLTRPGTPRPRRLSRGSVRDTRPRLCPDGHTLAFVRSDPTDDDALPALATMNIDRPDASLRKHRHRGHGAVGEVAWSPDGRRLAFTAEVDPPRFLVGSVPPVGRKPAPGAGDVPSPLARRMTRVDWRWDGEGHRDRWAHLFVIDHPGARPRQVTSGDWGVSDIAWAPDGRTIGFTTDRGTEPDIHPRSTIWAVDVDAAVDVDDAGAADTQASETQASEPREILAPGGWAARPSFSPDGRWIAAIGVLEPQPLDDVSPGILLGPAEGSRPPHALAPDLDRPIGNWVDTDLTGWMVSGRHGPVWLDEATVIATVSDRGRSRPRRFRLDPATGAATRAPTALPRDATPPEPEVVTHMLAVAGHGTIAGNGTNAGHGTIAGHGTNAGNGTIAVLGTLGSRAMELMTLDLAPDDDSPTWTTRSTFGSAWQRRHPMPEIRRFDVPGPGGPIETYVVSPPDAGGAALPTVVDVHGGPLGAWAPAPHLEVFLLAARGYRVVLPNIRGSATYGRDWIRPQLGDWGGVDAADVHAALDHVIELGLVDPDRVGVLGLSYGGFMVNWLVGTTDRFRAAVSENGVTNQVSDWANSDSGPEYDRATLLGDPFSPEGIERLWRQSPLRNVTAIRTPLLMLQGEADLRCPPQDNEQLFIALRHLGRTVEYVLYPEESHTYASAGRPDRRVDRMTRMLDWFDRYLR